MRTTNLRAWFGGWVLCAIALLMLAAPVRAADDDLVGLWTAQRRFGPEVHGPLVVRRDGAEYVADFVGRRLPMHEERGELVFALPDGQGTFRGKPEGRAIAGHWFRPGTAVNNSGDGTRHLAVDVSPVRLAADGPRRWRGVVAPPEETFTFHLWVTRRDYGTLAAVLRNPERDFGTQFGVHSLRRDGNAVVLLGKRGQQPEREVSRGAFDPETGVLTLGASGGW